RFLARLTLALVDDLQRLLPFFFGQILRAQKVDPELPVANPNDDVIRAETEAAQKIDAQRDQFDIRVERWFADDVGVELIMFAESAALLFLVTETVRNQIGRASCR